MGFYTLTYGLALIVFKKGYGLALKGETKHTLNRRVFCTLHPVAQFLESVVNK